MREHFNKCSVNVKLLSNMILSTSAMGTNTDSSSTWTFVLVILKYLSDVRFFYLSGLYYSFCICLCLYFTSINVKCIYSKYWPCELFSVKEV